ncbi:MAG: hypothetical protein ABI882_14965, partial [Acidobacteriota bacterium]
MTLQNRLFWSGMLVIVGVGFGWGYSQPLPQALAAPAPSINYQPSTSDETVAPVALIQGQGSCSPEVFMQNIERTEIGTVTESFVVTWAAGGACINKFEVSL